MSKLKILEDFERACQQAANATQRERVALEARNFLIQMTVPESIAEQINQQLDKDGLPSEVVTPLPNEAAELNHTSCALLEARLADFFPAIFHLRKSFNPRLVQLLTIKARTICQKVDLRRKYDYWVPLLDYLKGADETVWRRWRGASISQQNARTQVRQGDFRLAKFYAIYGLQNLSEIPDRRLYLDLCSRLQSAIAEGDGCLNVAVALANWIIQESLTMGHYLRAVGMGHNLGNQFLIAGKNDDAIKTLESAHKLSEDWWHIRDISYFQVALLERLARAYFNVGDKEKAHHCLELFGIHARNIRENVLYHLCKGDVAIRAANYEKAQREFHTVLKLVPNDESSDFKDSFGNIWNAYLSLGIVCLRTDSPERALNYFEAACAHGEKLDGFLNAERRSHYLLLVAEARIQKNELELAHAALMEMEKLGQQIVSPRLRIYQLFTNALLHEKQNDLTAAEDELEKALQICYENGFDDEKRKFEAVQKAIFN